MITVRTLSKATSSPGATENANYQNGPNSPYQDVIKGAIQYTGNFHPVNVTASAQIINGSAVQH